MEIRVTAWWVAVLVVSACVDVDADKSEDSDTDLLAGSPDPPLEPTDSDDETDDTAAGLETDADDTDDTDGLFDTDGLVDTDGASGTCAVPRVHVVDGPPSTGSTAGAAATLGWLPACDADHGGPVAGGERVYRVELASPTWLTTTVTPTQGTAVATYLLGTCDDPTSAYPEVCQGSASPGDAVSFTTLAPRGSHDVIVDSYGLGGVWGPGSYELAVNTALGPTCHGQVPVVVDAVSGATTVVDNTASGTADTTWSPVICGSPAPTGAERIFVFALNERTPVTIAVEAVDPDDSDFGVYVRTSCEEVFAEVACTQPPSPGAPALINTMMGPGPQFIFVDDFEASVDEPQTFSLTITLP